MDVLKAVENQNMIFDILKNAKKNNRLSHAYLFYGDEGVGKKEMAYALACLHYCPNGGCLKCDTCKSIIENNHMNVSYIGIENKKTVISKDQITELQEEFSKTSLVEGTRIYIVDGIDTASTAAQNSLLKFIEDPLNQTPTVGIFLAKELSNVVSTIISRCILQHFKSIPLNKSIDSLMNEGLEEIDAILSASMTNNLDSARTMAESMEFMQAKNMFLELISIKNKKESILYYLKYQKDINNQNILMLINWVLLFLEDIILHNKDNEELIMKPIADKERSYNNSHKNIKETFEIVLELSNKLRYNVSAKNVFHELISKLV